MRILVLRPGAIGDSLLTFPLLRALRTSIIDAHITFVSNAATLQLALDYGIADEVSDYSNPLWSQLFLESSRDGGGKVEGRGNRGPLWSSVRESLHERLQQTECAICWLTDVDGIVERNLQEEGVQQIIIAPGRPSTGERVHIVDYLARTMEPILVSVGAGVVEWRGGDPCGRPCWEKTGKICVFPEGRPQGSPPLHASTPAPTNIPIAIHPGSGAHKCTNVPFAIHPGSGGAHKCWSIGSFAAIMQRLWLRNIPVLLLAGPADAVRIQELLAHLSQPAQPTLLVTLFNAPLTTVAQQLRSCRGYLGNDTGITHLAAMLGIPTLALFGPSDPTIWHPVGPHVQILHEPNLQNLSIDRVMQTIEAFIL